MAQLLRGNADAVVAHMNQYVRPIELDTHIEKLFMRGVKFLLKVFLYASGLVDALSKAIFSTFFALAFSCTCF
jgi:hypothetical protein